VIKLVVLYGHPKDAAAFDKYYNETHIPLAQKIPGLKRIDACRAVATPDGSKPTHHVVADLWFDDMQQFQAAMGSAEGRATGADLANFATGGVSLMICEVFSAQGSL
jgi:uncharacterized protein (TIGR02118 family)